MAEDVDFDLEKFQDEVLGEFTFLKARKFNDNFIKNEELKKHFGKSFWGCFLIPLFIFTGKYGDSVYRQKEKEKNYKVFEREAADLLAQNEIKEAICKSLKETSRTEILTEDKFIKTVVIQTLAEKDVRKQFVIPLEPVLFACIAFQISEMGIENFCDLTAS